MSDQQAEQTSSTTYDTVVFASYRTDEYGVKNFGHITVPVEPGTVTMVAVRELLDHISQSIGVGPDSIVITYFAYLPATI